MKDREIKPKSPKPIIGCLKMTELLLISWAENIDCFRVFITCRLGRGGGHVVSVLAFYSDDLSSNPADVYSFICKISL